MHWLFNRLALYSEELYLLSLLSIICFFFSVFQVGIKHLVVYLNKADAVDDEEVIELVS